MVQEGRRWRSILDTLGVPFLLIYLLIIYIFTVSIDPSSSPEWLRVNTNIYVEMVRTPRRVQRSLIFSLWRRWRSCCAFPLFLFLCDVYLMSVAFDMIVFSSSWAIQSDHKDNNGGDMCLHTLRSLDYGSSMNGPIKSKFRAFFKRNLNQKLQFYRLDNRPSNIKQVYVRAEWNSHDLFWW